MKDDKKRVAAYSHIPISKKKPQITREEQEQKLTAFAKEHGWEISRFCSDEGKDYSGWDRLISDCQSGLIDLVICESLSCFRKNAREKIRMIRELSEIEEPVAFWFEEPGICTMDETGKLILTIMECVIEEESRQRSIRMKEYYRRKKEVKHE